MKSTDYLQNTSCIFLGIIKSWIEIENKAKAIRENNSPSRPLQDYSIYHTSKTWICSIIISEDKVTLDQTAVYSLFSSKIHRISKHIHYIYQRAIVVRGTNKESLEADSLWKAKSPHAAVLKCVASEVKTQFPVDPQTRSSK